MQYGDNTPLGCLTVGQYRQLQRDFIRTGQESYQPIINNLMDINDVCEVTGYSKAAIYKMVNQRQIPYHKPAHGGKKLVFVREEVENWFTADKVETIAEYADRKDAELCAGRS